MLSTLLLALSLTASADEGMWLPEQAPEVAARYADAGLELSPEQLSDPLGEPLGAIVSLGFCSGSFVSPEGLVATNHHCVEGFLQYVSDDETNRHRDGFTAPRPEDEAWVGPTGRLYVVEAVDDVTAEVTKGVRKGFDDRKRYLTIDKNIKAIVSECEERPGRRCSVRSFFGGRSYKRITTLEIRDVRLVHAPPMSAGQFGGEIDNWMWPRHSADYAFLRAFVGPDGEPADHGPDNVPFTPRHHLPFGADGVDEGEVVMVAGFPGRTNRHVPYEDLRHQIEEALPFRQRVYGDLIALLEGHAAGDTPAAAKLGPTISGLKNGFKNGQGLLDGLADPAILDRKRRWDATVRATAEGDRALLADLDAYDALRAADRADGQRDFVRRWLLYGSDLLSAATTAHRLAHERTKPDAKRDRGYQERDTDRIRARMERMQKGLVLQADADVFAYLLAEHAQLPEAEQIPGLVAFFEARGGYDQALPAMYTDPALATVDARLALLDATPDELAASEDPWVQLAGVLHAYHEDRRQTDEARRGAYQRLRPRWFEALERHAEASGQPLYDDANGTLRFTIGTVEGYRPRDGVYYTPFTHLDGLAAKVGEAPFDLPTHLADAAANDTSGIPVDVLSTLDITGGNSGSAVLDGQGRWVGLAFDGNYESIPSDWVFLEEVTRCLHVDVRFVEWMLRQQEDTERILEELGRDPG